MSSGHKNTNMPSPFISALNEYFERLKKDNVAFCVLSGYQKFPEVIADTDVDIIFLKYDFVKAEDVLKSTFKNKGFCYFSNHKFKGRHTYIFYSFGENGIIKESLKIDLFVNFEFRGRVFLNSYEIIGNIIPYENVYIPSIVHKNIMSILKGIMKGGSAWEKYLPKIQTGLKESKFEISVLLQRIFKEKTVDFLMLNLSKGRIDKIEQVRKKLIVETYTHSLLRSPITFILNLLGHYLIMGARGLRPPRYMFALLGPDGVGKSTLTSHIKSDLIEMLKVDLDQSKSFHIRPKLFPTITQLFKSRGISDKNPTKTYNAWQSNSFFISFCRLFFFWTDYVLGYFVKILPELIKYNVVVLDRYYYDILIDPLRYKIKLPYRILKMFYLLLPKPEVVFFLNAPPETIRQRKQELTIPQIERLLEKYRNLTSEFDNICITDATRSPDVISKEIVSIFLKKVALRL